jgi:hypothetical protein
VEEKLRQRDQDQDAQIAEKNMPPRTICRHDCPLPQAANE